MKHKNSYIKLIAAMLAMAIVITGFTFGDTMTAHAAVTEMLINCNDDTNIEDSTITLQPGDKLAFQYVYTSGSLKFNQTKIFDWECSDESIAVLYKEYTVDTGDNPIIDWLEVRAEKEGTVTITGTACNDETVSFTVVVKAPEMTAKQKACKHVWKTTRKATCMRNGTKACKKCKLTKVIKKKDHKFVTETETYTVYNGTYPIYVCQSCACVDPKTGRTVHAFGGFDGCDNLCGEEFDAKDYDTNHNGFDENDLKAAREAFEKHKEETYHGSGSLSQSVGYTNPEEIEREVTRCKTCGRTKEQIENAGQ